MIKLRARSRSFSNGSSKGHCEDISGANSSKDDFNIKPSGSGRDNNNRVDFPVELARSLQAFTASLSPPSTNPKPVKARPPPLKPILRSSISAGTEGKQGTSPGRASIHHTNSSVSSSASSKQISFLLPESPTHWGAATAPEFRDAARHPRQNSAASSSPAAASSTSTATVAVHTPRSSASRSSDTETSRETLHATDIRPTKQESNIIQIKAKNSMHVRRSSDVTEERRPSLESSSKDLPPLPLNASAPASSASLSSRGSSRQSGHARGESASSAASSVLSNPIHLPRLKLGDPSLGNLFNPALDSPQSNRREDRTGYSPFDDKKFAWMGLGRKRDSSESKGSSKRRSDSSVVASLHSLPMNKHQRSRSSQLDVVHESDPAEITLKHAPVPTVVEPRNQSRIPFERNLSSSSRDEAARMTQLWVTLLEDFVLLCDDSSRPSSQRSSTSSHSSSYIAPPSPSQFTSDLLLPPGGIDIPCPTSPSPSSECDPFLRLPSSSSRRKRAPITKPLPPSPMPSLEVDDSVGSTTCTQSPSTPAETQSPGVPSRVSYNPFEASFSGVGGGVTASTSSASDSTATQPSFLRRSSVPNALGSSSGEYGASRPGKSRPPPLNLPSVSASNESIHTAVPPQTQAQTYFYTSQRSKSLPTSNLEPGSYRQPISPCKRDLEAEQLGASTSSTGSNRASRRYHFPSSYGAPVGMENLNMSTTASMSSARRRNKSIDEGYSGTGLTPTPTSDTFSIPSRSRETSVSSTSEAVDFISRGSCTTADTSLPPSPISTSEGKRTPDNSLSKSVNSNLSSNTSTPQAKRYTESTRTRSKRSQSASEHVRKKSSEVGPALKRSPTSIEIVMYGLAL